MVAAVVSRETLAVVIREGERQAEGDEARRLVVAGVMEGTVMEREEEGDMKIWEEWK
jgi:hypothetical protein